jgi:hypothetical protein
LPAAFCFPQLRRRTSSLATAKHGGKDRYPLFDARAGQMLSLSHAALEPAEKAQLVGFFDSFVDHVEGEFVGEAQDSFEHGCRWCLAFPWVEEGPVDFEEPLPDD